jgi:protein phosphatase
MPYKITAYGLSDIGKVRHNNEDVWAELPECHFYALADGMGGHQAGEVASREAIKILCKLVKRNDTENTGQISLQELRKNISHFIEQVNFTVFRLGRSDAKLKGMGTTLCCLSFHSQGLVYGHVGDSRIYRLRNEKLTPLTKDHSLLRELVELGQISEHQSGEFLYKNIITKAIGTEPKVEPSVHLTMVEPNDLYMMCTDGLSDLLTTKEMQDILLQYSTPEEQVVQLIARANELGGHDNITVVVLKVEEPHETPQNIPR